MIIQVAVIKFSTILLGNWELVRVYSNKNSLKLEENRMFYWIIIEVILHLLLCKIGHFQNMEEVPPR